MQTEPKFQPRNWLATIMVGKNPTRYPCSEEEWRALLETAATNGVIALCHQQVAELALKEQCADWFCDDLKKYTHRLAAGEMAQTHELKQVLAEFARENIFPLLMKGAPLSYNLYPKPYLRERCDTDMLFRDRDQANAARDLLEKRGYQQPNAVSGDFVSHQFACYRTTGMGVTHSLDMHWHLNNDHFFARAFSYEEFAQSAIPIPNLGEHARTLEPVHALLLACMHRVGHLKGGIGNRLVWLYDIHLLTGQLSEQQWTNFEELTLERNLESVCLDSIKATRKAFNTKIPGSIVKTLQSRSQAGGYAPQNANQIWQAQLMSLRSLPGWRAKATLLREQFFPASSYMLEKYQIKHPITLPYYYVLRTIQGVPKMFRNVKQD